MTEKAPSADTLPAQDSETPEVTGNQPNDPAEGPREMDKGKEQNKDIPSTHVPDTRAFDL